MEKQTEDIGPWYKQVWLWFILAPLIAVVIYATTFMVVAVTTSDGIVKDDYYRVARGTNVDTSRADLAAQMGIRGDILIDSLTGDIRLQLSANDNLPQQLTLDLVHPTHQRFDQSIGLRPVDESTGIYLGSLQGELTGKRYLLLSDPSDGWSLRREINPPYDQQSFALGAPN